MQAKESKNAFVCFHLFFGIGTFQWVTADSNKKIRLRLKLARRVVIGNVSSSRDSSSRPGCRPKRGSIPSMRTCIPLVSGFGKQIRQSTVAFAAGSNCQGPASLRCDSERVLQL
jgi:hypothetical protein